VIIVPSASSSSTKKDMVGRIQALQINRPMLISLKLKVADLGDLGCDDDVVG